MQVKQKSELCHSNSGRQFWATKFDFPELLSQFDQALHLNKLPEKSCFKKAGVLCLCLNTFLLLIGIVPALSSSEAWQHEDAKACKRLTQRIRLPA